MLKVCVGTKGGQVKPSKESPFRFIQHKDTICSSGSPLDQFFWRLEGNLGKYHAEHVLCLLLSQSSWFWTLENGLGKPLLCLFLGLMFKGLILKPLQRLLRLWKASEWGRQN